MESALAIHTVFKALVNSPERSLSQIGQADITAANQTYFNTKIFTAKNIHKPTSIQPPVVDRHIIEEPVKKAGRTCKATASQKISDSAALLQQQLLEATTLQTNKRTSSRRSRSVVYNPDEEIPVKKAIPRKIIPKKPPVILPKKSSDLGTSPKLSPLKSQKLHKLPMTALEKISKLDMEICIQLHNDPILRVLPKHAWIDSVISFGHGFDIMMTAYESSFPIEIIISNVSQEIYSNFVEAFVDPVDCLYGVKGVINEPIYDFKIKQRKRKIKNKSDVVMNEKQEIVSSEIIVQKTSPADIPHQNQQEELRGAEEMKEVKEVKMQIDEETVNVVQVEKEGSLMDVEMKVEEI